MIFLSHHPMKPKIAPIAGTIICFFLVLTVSTWAQSTSDKPNVILIYVDDLGYGDLSCYGATKVQTPNIDRLASEGRSFFDAHSPSAVCTP